MVRHNLRRHLPLHVGLQGAKSRPIRQHHLMIKVKGRGRGMHMRVIPGGGFMAHVQRAGEQIPHRPQQRRLYPQRRPKGF
jgi:hypothetical protein